MGLSDPCGYPLEELSKAHLDREEHRDRTSGNDAPNASIYIALSNWRTLWVRSYHQLSERKRATAGMFRNGDYFWLVTQLLVQSPAATRVINTLDINCEDALAQLNSLLQ